MIKILTIGNSFADNATRYLEAMAAEGETELLLGKANVGGCSLEKHWNLVEQCRLLPDVKPYSFYMTGVEKRALSLEEALKISEWDIVTLQQLSSISFKKESYYPYIYKLAALVRELAPKAQIVIHQTWAYRCDSPDFIGWGMSQKDMFNYLKEAYEEAASKLQCRIIPCGEAFQKAREIFNYRVDSNYNFANPLPLELPEQSRSLNVGYQWATGNTASGRPELHMDARHADVKGCYLANAVFYEMLLGKSIYENKYCPEGITAGELKILKDAAHQAVAGYGGALK